MLDIKKKKEKEKKKRSSYQDHTVFSVSVRVQSGLSLIILYLI